MKITEPKYEGVYGKDKCQVLELFNNPVADWNEEADQLMEIAKEHQYSIDYIVHGDRSLLHTDSFLKLFKGTQNIYCTPETFAGVKFDKLFELACNFTNEGCFRLRQGACSVICDMLNRMFPRTDKFHAFFEEAYFDGDKLIAKVTRRAAVYLGSTATAVVGKCEQLDKIDFLLSVDAETIRIVDLSLEDFYRDAFQVIDFDGVTTFYIGFE